jgi:proteasome assembly chaperone (PAC2) family protein
MIELEDIPELNDPVLIAAFEGWNDAGEAASAVIEHLADIWSAEPVAAFDPEDYYDFQVNRPRVVIDGGSRRISWRTTRVLLATDTPLGRDVLLVQGIEPSFRWRAFTIELMQLAQEAGVCSVITLGALVAAVAH